MAETTEKYGLRTPSQNDFFDVKDVSENMEKLENALTEFDDSGTVEDIKSFPDFLTKLVTGNKLAVTIRNLKAGLQFVLHAGQIVNNCVTDNAGLPLSAAQGKALMDKYTQLYSDLNTTNNNLSNGLYGTTQDTTLDQLMKHMSDWNHPFVFDIGYTLPIAPDNNNAVGIGERGMLHAFSYSGKHFYCIDASKGWQESPYALKSDLINTKYLVNEFNAYNDTIVLTSTATDGSKIQLSTDGTNLYLNKKLKGATDWTTVWKK